MILCQQCIALGITEVIVIEQMIVHLHLLMQIDAGLLRIETRSEPRQPYEAVDRGRPPHPVIGFCRHAQDAFLLNSAHLPPRKHRKIRLRLRAENQHIGIPREHLLHRHLRHRALGR